MHEVDGLNAGYASALLEQYLENPEAVPSEWRALFESGASELVATHPGLARLVELLQEDGNGHVATTPAPAPAPPGPAAAEPAPSAAPVEAAPDKTLLAAVAAAMALVKAYRTHGHLAARLDPLGSEPVGDPSLEPGRLEPKLTPELQRLIPADILRVHVPGETLADVLPRLRETYCGTSAYEIEHISDHEQRVWLRSAIESGRYRRPLDADEKRRLLERLSEVEGFERYLRRAFLGQKQFSIEGLDVMIPMLDEAIALVAEEGAHEVVFGMAHRGRLNVLAHVLGRPYETILREFEGERTLEAVASDPEGGTGDVKYHLGAEGSRPTPSGDITLTLASNPSHLEAVDPVVEGRTRAEQTDRSSRTGYHDSTVAMPIQIHGDAAFPAQGVVAETLNLADLNGYSTGGTLHLIANNQIGFTTDPADGRSTRYSSDLAKGFDLPIIHVNADDPEASLAAIRLALAFRRRFCTDVVIDLVGYRRHGHNEQDEAAYTQPLMAALIERQPSVREQYAEELVDEEVVSQEEADALVAAVDTRLKEAHERLKTTFGQEVPAVAYEGRIPASSKAEIVTAVGGDRLRELNEELLAVPDGFTVNPKLAKQLERRRDAIDQGGIDWGQAEELAFASLLVEGTPGPPHRPGHRARHVLASSPRAARRPQRPGLRARAEPARGDGVVRDPQLAALGRGVRRVRVRLLRRRARGSRRLGGAVRRLRQRRAGGSRPVHRLRALEVGPDLTSDASAPARLRRQWAGAFERAPGALSPARRAGEHPHRQLHHRGTVLPPLAPPGARPERSTPRRDDPEGAAAAEAGGVRAARA